MIDYLSRARLHAAWLLLLLGVLIIANYNIVFFGESLVASADYHPFDYRFTHLKPGSFPEHAFVNWYDLGGVWWQWEPAGQAFSKAFRAGKIPLWDPRIAGGVDAHVNLTQGQYYPPYMLLLLLGDTPFARDYYYLAQLFVSGVFCYLLLRKHGLHPLSGVAMGVMYMLSGSLIQYENSIVGQAFAVLPAMVWAADFVLSRADWRGTGIAALVMALLALSSFLPVVISGYILVALYCLVDVVMRPAAGEGWRRSVDSGRAFKAAAAILLSLMAVGFLLIPLQFASSRDTGFSRWYPNLGLQALSPDQLLTLVSPTISYDVDQARDASKALFLTPWSSTFFYIGLVPILLALCARPGANPRHRKLFVFFCGSGTFVLFKMLGVPPFQWVGYLPILNSIHFVPYFSGALTFAVCGMAALGVERVIRERNASVPAAIATVGLAGVAGMLLRFAQTHPLNAGLQGAVFTAAVLRNSLEASRITLLALALIAVLRLRSRMRPATAGAMVLALVCMELVPLAVRARFLRADVWNDVPDYVRFLQNDHSLFRVHGVHDLTLTANVAQGVNLSEVSSRMSFNSSRYSEVIHSYFESPNLPYPIASSLLPTSRVILNLLNVKYLILFSPTPEQAAGLRSQGLELKHQDGEFHIYENPAVWARAYLANTIRRVDAPAQSLTALSTLQPAEAVIEGLDATIPDTSPLDPAGDVVDRIEEQYDRITIHVRATRPRLLVLSENYSPGWEATVQGKAAPILIANHAFQAVAIPSGSVDVHFEYTTPGLGLGLGLSVLSLILIGAGIAEPAIRRRRAVEGAVSAPLPHPSVQSQPGPNRDRAM